MNYIPGLAYPHTGSLAYPRRTRSKLVHDNSMLAVVLELVHPGNLGALPPSPSLLAYKGEQMGIAKYSEFYKELWY